MYNNPLYPKNEGSQSGESNLVPKTLLLSKAGIDHSSLCSCGEFCEFLDSLVKQNIQTLPEGLQKKSEELKFIHVLPREDLFLSDTEKAELERLSLYDRELNEKIILTRDLSFLQKHSINLLTEKTSGLSGLGLWITGRRSTYLERLEEKREQYEKLQSELHTLTEKVSDNSGKIRALDQKKRDLAATRDLYVEAQDGENFLRIEERGRAMLAFMRAYGSDFRRVPFSAFLKGSIELAQAIQEQIAEIVCVKTELCELGVTDSVASELAMVAPFYEGTEELSQRILDLAGAIEKSGLPTKDLIDTVRGMVLLPGTVDEIVGQTKEIFNECTRQGMDESSSTLFTAMPLIRLLNEKVPKEHIVDSLLVVKEKIEENFSLYNVSPVTSQFLAAQLATDDCPDTRFERFESLVEYLHHTGLPRDRATLGVAVQLSKSKSPADLLVPQVLFRMNTVFERWGRSSQLIGVALDVAMTPGLVSPNLMILEDLCERLRHLGIQRGRPSKAISLLRNLQAKMYETSSNVSEPLFESGIESTSKCSMPNEGLLLLAPTQFFDLIKTSLFEDPPQASVVQGVSEQINNDSFSDLSTDTAASSAVYGIDVSLPFSGRDALGISSASFISDGITSSGFDSGGFNSSGGYDSGFSSSSFDGGGSSSVSSCGSSSSSCGSSSSSCGSSSSSCGGGGGCGGS
jgi:hypothetical protein